MTFILSNLDVLGAELRLPSCLIPLGYLLIWMARCFPAEGCGDNLSPSRLEARIEALYLG